MKTLILFCVLGITTTAFSFPVEIQPSDSNRVQRCDARATFARDRLGGRCPFSDEVMVGIRRLDPLTIRCARLEVTCYDRVSKDEESAQETDS